MKSGLYIISDNSSKSEGILNKSGKNLIRILIATLCVSSLISCLIFLCIRDSNEIDKISGNENDSNLVTETDLDEDETRVHITTESGVIVGKRYKVFNTEVDVFLGIPYAEPPIGELRFKNAIGVKPWDGILKAWDYSPACLQFRLRPVKQTPWTSMHTQSENCLYLNIWSPIETKNNTKLKTVMVFIHGGAFISGSSDVHYYDGRILAAYGNLVVVTLNYRLSIFGFLNSNEDSASGNMGLIDQVLALKWIKNNIKYFGGDSEDITLFGESAGAFSIGFHMVSPMSRHLFKRAILQSGSPLNPQIFEDQQLAVERANQIAVNVGCADDRITLMEKPELVVKCLRNIEALKLIEEEENLMEGFHPPFGVTIGDDFLPKNPYEALNNGEIGSQKEVMIGTNADEGSFFLHYTFPETFSADLPKNVTAEEAILYLEDSFKFLPQPMPKLITHFFLSGFDSQDYQRIRKAFYETIGDFIILCPTVYFSEKLTEQKVNVYYYFFTYRPQNTNWTKWMGVTHFEEVQFVFGTPFIKLENYTPEEREFSTKLMDMWTNFAKNGYPLKENEQKWPLYSFEERNLLELNPNNIEPKIGSGPHETNCNLWRFIFDSAAPAK